MPTQPIDNFHLSARVQRLERLIVVVRGGLNTASQGADLAAVKAALGNLSAAIAAQDVADAADPDAYRKYAASVAENS